MRLPGRSPSSIRVRALASVGIEIDDVGVLHFADREESPTRTQLEAVQRERARARALPDRLVRLVAEAPAAVASGFLSTPVSDLVREESEQGGMAGDHRRESRACLQDARLGASDGPSPARRSWPKREDASVSLGRFHSWRSDGDGGRRQCWRSLRTSGHSSRQASSLGAGRSRAQGRRRTLVSAGRTKDARRCSSAGKRVGGPEPGWQRPTGSDFLSRLPRSVSGYRRRRFRWNTRTVAHCRGGNRTTRDNRRTGWDRCVHQGEVAGNSRDTVSTSTVPAYRGSRRTRRLRLCSH